MDSATHSYIGIDIAKDSLQVHAPHYRGSVPNTVKGIERLLGRLDQHEDTAPLHVVCEASGGYERLLLDQLHQQGRRVSLVSAARVRAFVHSQGVKAKNDPIDAHMLWRYARQNHPRPTPAPSPARQSLMAFLDRRAHLSEQLKREKTRRQNSPQSIHDSIDRMLQVLHEELQRLHRQIRALIEAEPAFKILLRRFLEVVGIGEVTAWTILAYLPEISTLKRNEVVALAGLAPYDQDSGKTRKVRRIFGGRAKIRRTLYLAATCAARYNPIIEPYVRHLREDKAKPYKCAIVAAMRKLLLHLRAIVREEHIVLA